MKRFPAIDSVNVTEDAARSSPILFSSIPSSTSLSPTSPNETFNFFEKKKPVGKSDNEQEKSDELSVSDDRTLSLVSTPPSVNSLHSSPSTSSTSKSLPEDPQFNFPAPSLELIHEPKRLPRLYSLGLLSIIALLSSSIYFNFRVPSAIASELTSNYLSTQAFGLLFTVYSIPSFITPWIGGAMIDRIGIVHSSLIFNTCCFIGTIIFALGSKISKENSFILFLLGRVFLGLGGQSVIAAQQTMCSLWFKDKMLTFGMGFTEAFVQIFGSAMSFIILSPIAEHFSLEVSLWFGVLWSIISLSANIGYAFFDRKFREYRIVQTGSQIEKQSSEENTIPTNNNKKKKNMSKWKFIFALKSFPKAFWVLFLLITVSTPTLIIFTAFAPLYLQNRWGLLSSKAGQCTSVLYGTIVFAPVIGTIMDRVGYRAIFQFIGHVFAVGFFILFYLGPNFFYIPWLAMIGLGLAYAITESNAFTMVAIVVPSEQLGLAFGLVNVGLTCSLFILPYIVGSLVTDGDYSPAALLFVCTSTFVAVLTLILIICDRNDLQILTSKTKKNVPPSKIDNNNNNNNDVEFLELKSEQFITKSGMIRSDVDNNDNNENADNNGHENKVTVHVIPHATP